VCHPCSDHWSDFYDGRVCRPCDEELRVR
jgi:hypothetical protein